MPDFFCAQEARDADAPLTATAQRVDVWFLIEVNLPWERHAFEEGRIPDAVRAYLAAQAAAIPNSRIQLIRRDERSRAGVHFEVALSREQHPVRYAFDLARIEDLPTLDIPSVVAEHPEFQAHRRHELLYLVCTNGKRDRCCALRGTPVYAALARHVSSGAWQTTHVGGHRYGANMVVMPHGLYYGRLDGFDLAQLVRALERGEVYLPAYRGRSCYPPEVQAAETFLREQTGELRLDRFRLESAESTAPNRWLVCFASPGDGATHELELSAEPSPYHIHASCGDDKAGPVTVYRLTGYRPLSGN